MRLRASHISSYRLEMKRPFETALGTFDYRKGILLTLEDEFGNTGLGDACPVPGFSKENRDQAYQDLQAFCDSAWNKLRFDSLGEIAKFCKGLDACASAKNAIEQALADLMAKGAQIPLAKLLSNDASETVETGTLIQDSHQAKESSGNGFKILKLKVGVLSVEEDKAKIQAILDSIPEGVMLRLDANRSLSFDDAVVLLGDLQPEQIEFIEEPLLPEFQSRLSELRKQTSVPIALDESVVDEDALLQALTQQWCDVVVIKPMMCGGPLQAFRYAALAAEYGVDCAFTSSLESIVGRLGTMHVAAATPKAHCRAAGLNTGILFEKDLAPDPKINAGLFVLPSQAGIGVSKVEGL